MAHLAYDGKVAVLPPIPTNPTITGLENSFPVSHFAENPLHQHNNNDAKELLRSLSNPKEMGFELETLVRQFNVLGNAKKGRDGVYATTADTLKKTKRN